MEGIEKHKLSQKGGKFKTRRIEKSLTMINDQNRIEPKVII